MTERAARRIVLALLRRIRHGSLELVEGDRSTLFGAAEPRATVIVRSANAWPALLRGGVGLGESYVEGWWDSPDATLDAAGYDERFRRTSDVQVVLAKPAMTTATA